MIKIIAKEESSKYKVFYSWLQKKILVLFILNKRQLKALFQHWNFDKGFQIELINAYTFQILEYAHMCMPVLVCACGGGQSML